MGREAPRRTQTPPKTTQNTLKTTQDEAPKPTTENTCPPTIFQGLRPRPRRSLLNYQKINGKSKKTKKHQDSNAF